MNWSISANEIFNASPVIPVMVIKNIADALPMVKALADGGIHIFEVTLRTDIALEAIALITQEMPNAMVGAGTVLNAKQYDQAVAAGAKFVISPGYSHNLLAHAKQGTAPLIPGVASTSEIITALEFGYDHLKFFPAEANGGTKALHAISAPLPMIHFCPTGGINLNNAADYLKLNCVTTLGGSWMLPTKAIEQGNWEQISALAKATMTFIETLKA